MKIIAILENRCFFISCKEKISPKCIRMLKRYILRNTLISKFIGKISDTYPKAFSALATHV